MEKFNTTVLLKVARPDKSNAALYLNAMFLLMLLALGFVTPWSIVVAYFLAGGASRLPRSDPSLVPVVPPTSRGAVSRKVGVPPAGRAARRPFRLPRLTTSHVGALRRKALQRCRKPGSSGRSLVPRARPARGIRRA